MVAKARMAASGMNQRLDLEAKVDFWLSDNMSYCCSRQGKR